MTYLETAGSMAPMESPGWHEGASSWSSQCCWAIIPSTSGVDRLDPLTGRMRKPCPHQIRRASGQPSGGEPGRRGRQDKDRMPWALRTSGEKGRRAEPGHR